MPATAFAKAPASRRLRAVNATVDARSKPLAQALSRWLARYARVLVDRELRRELRKADDDRVLAEELRRLLRLYGVRTFGEAASSTGAWSVSPGAVDDFLATKDIRVTGIMAETRERVREDLRRLIRESLKETPQPGASGVARRVREAFFGGGERPFAVSSERAALIARTEMVQAENSGIVEGYKASGVEWIEWLANTDGASGDRHHERMNGKRVKVGDYFTTPLGNRLRYPGDPDAPIKETANCRCTVAAVRGLNKSHARTGDGRVSWLR